MIHRHLADLDHLVDHYPYTSSLRFHIRYNLQIIYAHVNAPAIVPTKELANAHDVPVPIVPINIALSLISTFDLSNFFANMTGVNYWDGYIQSKTHSH